MPQMRRATFEQANLMLEGMEVTQSLDMGAYIMHTGRHWQLGRTVLIIGANEDCAIISRAVAAPVEVKDVAERVTLRLC